MSDSNMTIDWPHQPVPHGLHPLIEFVFSFFLSLVAPWLCQAVGTEKGSKSTSAR